MKLFKWLSKDFSDNGNYTLEKLNKRFKRSTLRGLAMYQAYVSSGIPALTCTNECIKKTRESMLRLARESRKKNTIEHSVLMSFYNQKKILEGYNRLGITQDMLAEIARQELEKAGIQ